MNTTEEAQPPASSQPQRSEQASVEDINRINQELYKRNVELAFRNKTLALLRQMYATTLTSLELQPLAQQLVNTLRDELKLAIVGIYLRNENSLQPLVFSRSVEVEEVATKYKHPLHGVTISLDDASSAFVQSFQSQQRQEVIGLQGLWKDDLPMLQELHTEAKITNTLVFPLVASGEAFGVLLLSLYKPFAEYTYFETEAIEAVVRVIAVALDKAEAHEELRVANQHLKENYEKQEKLLEMRSMFLNIASHQLRTPVTVINGTLAMMQEDDWKKIDEATQKEMIRGMQVKGLKLHEIINDILAASEMDSIDFKPDLIDDVDVNEWLKEVVDSRQEQAKEKKLPVTYEPMAKSVKVHISRRYLDQAMYNLIDNAVHYTEKGWVKVSAQTTEKDGKKGLLITVADTGMGIPAGEIPKLFDKFVRAENARRMYPDGSGLGLFICKKIIDGHPGGKIWIESEEGKGSQFHIFLAQ